MGLSRLIAKTSLNFKLIRLVHQRKQFAVGSHQFAVKGLKTSAFGVPCILWGQFYILPRLASSAKRVVRLVHQLKTTSQKTNAEGALIESQFYFSTISTSTW